MGPGRGLRGSWGSRDSVGTEAGAAAGGGAPVGSIRLRTCQTQDTRHEYGYVNGGADQEKWTATVLPSLYTYQGVV